MPVADHGRRPPAGPGGTPAGDPGRGSAGGPEVPRQPSIKDVAGRAGVSFQTASKVLRGGGSVADETRSRIVAVASELGYVPNSIARSLVTRRTRTIGVAVGDLSDHIIAGFVTGAEQEARRRDHALVVVSVDPGTSDGERSLRSLLERRVDGIVLAAPQLEDDERLADLLADQPGVVSIHTVAGARLRLVGSDQVETARLATEHLTSHGHRRIGMVTGRRTRRAALARERGFTAALEAAGCTVDPRSVAEGDWQPSGGYAAARAVLQAVPEVTALYVHNDLMAIGALHAAHDLGRRVPEDLAVVGCDDIPSAQHTIPTLTTVRIPFADTGAAAVRILLEEPERTPGSGPLLLPVSLVRRRSCGCTPESDPQGRGPADRSEATEA